MMREHRTCLLLVLAFLGWLQLCSLCHRTGPNHFKMHVPHRSRQSHPCLCEPTCARVDCASRAATQSSPSNQTIKHWCVALSKNIKVTVITNRALHDSAATTNSTAASPQGLQPQRRSGYSRAETGGKLHLALEGHFFLASYHHLCPTARPRGKLLGAGPSVRAAAYCWREKELTSFRGAEEPVGDADVPAMDASARSRRPSA